MKTDLLKTARHPVHAKKGQKINQKLVAFLACLLISAFLWFMKALSKKYTDAVSFQVQYSHLPHDPKYVPPAGLISLTLTTSGYNLFAYKLGFRESLINVDVNSFRRMGNMYIYNLQNEAHQEKIRNQLGEQAELVSITPDTLFLRQGEEK